MSSFGLGLGPVGSGLTRLPPFHLISASDVKQRTTDTMEPSAVAQEVPRRYYTQAAGSQGVAISSKVDWMVC